MIVVDASAIVEVLLRSATGDALAARLLSPSAGLNAPYLIDVEVAHVFRGTRRKGT